MCYHQLPISIYTQWAPYNVWLLSHCIFAMLAILSIRSYFELQDWRFCLSCCCLIGKINYLDRFMKSTFPWLFEKVPGGRYTNNHYYFTYQCKHFGGLNCLYFNIFLYYLNETTPTSWSRRVLAERFWITPTREFRRKLLLLKMLILRAVVGCL